MIQQFEFNTSKSLVVARGGSGSVLVEKILAMGCRTPFVVTDRGVLSVGLLEKTLVALKQGGMNTATFSEVLADPPESVILAATNRAIEHGADCVIGFGGGSSMDVAKLVAVLARGREHLSDIYGVGQIKGSRLPLVLVPTTAGTGSEVTPISIVTTGESEKKGVVSPVLLPDLAFLDAELTVGLPPHITAATGIDAMVHAIEAYTSKRLKNPVSDCLAREALRLLAENIRTACASGNNLAARENMLLGACLAGIAFANSPVAGVHALAYPVGARFHVAHGLSNSLVLPSVMRFNLSQAAELYAELAGVIGANVGTYFEKATWFVDYLAALPAELGLETRLSQVGIQEKDLDDLASDAMKQTRLLINNPREIHLSDARAIYSEAL